MRVSVNYLGQLAEMAGTDSDTREYGQAPRLIALLTDLASTHGPDFAQGVLAEPGRIRPSLLVLINGQAADKTSTAPLADGDEVTLLPPLAGG